MADNQLSNIEYIFNSNTNVTIMVNAKAIENALKDENLKREKYNKDALKLKKALINDDGMYIIKNYISIDNQAVSCIVKTGFILEKLNDITAFKLVEDGKAITVNEDKFALMKKNFKSTSKN
ncbi:MAG: hypothetical protein IKZ58_04535 [Selenomonadaceae bacterium]|nr:hypothetical protein [Selenomonadaceae bacterium]